MRLPTASRRKNNLHLAASANIPPALRAKQHLQALGAMEFRLALGSMAHGGGASTLASAAMSAMSAGTGSTLYAAASVAAALATSAGTGVAVAVVASAAGATLWWTVAAVCPPVLTARVAAVGYAYWTNLVSTQAAVKIQCKPPETGLSHAPASPEREG